jgi:cytochrome b
LNSVELLLIGAVLAIGVFHTMVPDHWLPIVLMARQRKWSTQKTALAALQAWTGHVVSTLLIAALFWGAGAAVATRFSGWVETATSVSLVGFG